MIRDFREPINRQDLEIAIGERVLLLLLGVATVMAAVFLLLPFMAIRETFAALPRKKLSFVYFGALGLGFLFFEITLIQRLTLFLGYPTYSLTVTLASILVFTGVGAWLTGRYEHRRERVIPALAGAVVVLAAAGRLRPARPHRRAARHAAGRAGPGRPSSCWPRSASASARSCPSACGRWPT